MSATTTDPALRVQAVFAVHGGDDERAYAVVAELIDRLNAIANLPECECDVDISVERAPAPDQGSG